MKEKSRRVASCGMMTAVCVVLMLLGAVLELGMYAAPMFAGLCLVPLGEKWGRKYQSLLWAAVSVLSFLLVPNVEENLMFACFFGWYPILRPTLQKLPKPLRMPVKLLVFNGAVIAVEAMVLLFFVPETLGTALMAALLVMGNVAFVLYDYVIPRTDILMRRIMKKRK